MHYRYQYRTPDGFSNMIMNSDGERLTGLCFVGSKDIAKLNSSASEKLLPVFEETISWLDVYFGGGIPSFTPAYRMAGLTPFRREIMELLLQIPYGSLTTYGELARIMAERRAIGRMSAQAVGGAVGWNPICLIIPCHRVVGADYSLTGYGGGIENKVSLLRLEGHDMAEFHFQKGKKTVVIE